MAGKEKPQRHIQSINVGFQLIRCLIDAPHSLSLKELCEQSGLQTGHAFLYLTSFREVGLVRQDSTTSRYELGPLALDLGLAAMRRTDVIALAKDPMYALEASTNQSVLFAVWGNRGPTVVATVDGPHTGALVLALGYVMPLLETASGRVFLAYLPREQTKALLAAELRAGPSFLQTTFTAAGVEKIVAGTRAQGYSRSDPLRDDGFASVAVPIFDHASAIRATISLNGPKHAFEARFDEYRDAALTTAATISERLGFRPGVPMPETRRTAPVRRRSL
jgi:DNA-binding IclR family transcriptional regulator